MRFFVGTWTGSGSGQPGVSTIDREYVFVLNERFLEVRNKSTDLPQEKKSPVPSSRFIRRQDSSERGEELGWAHRHFPVGLVDGVGRVTVCGQTLALTTSTELGDHPQVCPRPLTSFLRRLMLLISLVSLVPAAGAALCLGEQGHVAIELMAEHCDVPEVSTGTACDAECGDCEDIPLSLGLGERVTQRQEFQGLSLVAACATTSLISGWTSLVPCSTARPATIRPVSFASHPSPLRC